MDIFKDVSPNLCSARELLVCDTCVWGYGWTLEIYSEYQRAISSQRLDVCLLRRSWSPRNVGWFGHGGGVTEPTSLIIRKKKRNLLDT